ncbi:uncharacterized protein LOC122879449 isoform X2 [Siniperca chuatsi]|uniref:uncharacterized protein LOC122879449 isoform X2 n=1 Tax=Siniperca chuatsi TaxID=119488 RepID=UPI001CE21227|nr:uncharacterized protein LOC122879449 isoform X2 [Siniperca chuatsi]
MASCCNPQFLNPRHSLHLLALVLTVTWHFSLTESAGKIQLKGEVGGNVTFRCPVVKQQTIKFFYLQRGPHIFVNGFYESKKVQPWENTRLGHDKTTVHMDSLNISHSGDYLCLIMYSDSHKTETVIQLSVTANYSKPEATVSCRDRFSCLVTCTSHGGYPGTKMMWNVNGSLDWKVVNNSDMSDPVTMMFNSSSTAHFNCSNGEREFSCHVGNVTSNMFPICTPQKKDPNNHFVIIAAATCSILVFFSIVVWLWRKCKTGQKGGEATDVRQECGVNGWR